MVQKKKIIWHEEEKNDTKRIANIDDTKEFVKSNHVQCLCEKMCGCLRIHCVVD